MNNTYQAIFNVNSVDLGVLFPVYKNPHIIHQLKTMRTEQALCELCHSLYLLSICLGVLEH